MSTAVVFQPRVQEAFELYSQALDHLDRTLTESVCAEAELIFGDLAVEVSFAAGGDNFFVEVKGRDGEAVMLDDPTSPLAVSCALYFSLLGNGAYTVDLSSRTRVPFRG